MIENYEIEFINLTGPQRAALKTKKKNGKDMLTGLELAALKSNNPKLMKGLKFKVNPK